MLRLNIRISRKVGRTILSKPGIFFEEAPQSAQKELGHIFIGYFQNGKSGLKKVSFLKAHTI